MIKLFGCILIILAGAGCGNIMSDKLKSNLITLKTILLLIDETEIMLGSEYMSTNEIIDVLSQKKAYSQLGIFHDINRLDINSSMSKNIQKSNLLNNDDKAKLSCFFEELGTTNLNGQLTKLNLCKAYFANAVLIAEQKYDSHAKLYRAMGVLCGAFAAILLV